MIAKPPFSVNEDDVTGLKLLENTELRLPILVLSVDAISAISSNLAVPRFFVLELIRVVDAAAIS